MLKARVKLFSTHNCGLFAFLFLGLFIKAQPGTQSLNVSVPNGTKFTIEKIVRDSFPVISATFIATNREVPVFNIPQSKIQLTDDSKKCQVLSLQPVKQKQSLNVCIVIDHSGSMKAGGKDNNQLRKQVDSVFKQLGLDTSEAYRNAVNKIIPEEKSKNFLLEAAKPSLINFVNTLNTGTDSISIVGFADAADVVLPLLDNKSYAIGVINSISTTGGSAIIDGMIAGVNQLKYAGGKRLMIVLTDGQETAAQSKINLLVEKSLTEKIPIYIVGVGDASTSRLTEIAKNTKGEYYYANTNSGMEAFMEKISAKEKEKARYIVRAKCMDGPDPGDSVATYVALSNETIIKPVSKDKESLPPGSKPKDDKQGAGTGSAGNHEPGDK